MSDVLPPIDTSRSGPARSVTAPELAPALERLPIKHQERCSRIAEERRSSSDSAEDKLNDLAAEPVHRRSERDESPTSTDSEPEKPTPREQWPLGYSLPTFRLPSKEAWREYFMQEVAADKYLEFQLLLMTVVTGCLDAMTYVTYNVFASKQTGNTLFLALHAMHLQALPPQVEQNVGVSMGVFVAGAIFFGHIGHISRQRRRIWLLLSNIFQAFLVLAAAAIRYWGSRHHVGPGALGILTCLAFAESGQIANALNTAMPELNTTMITGALIQLCTDRHIFRKHNSKRNRRLAFLGSMFIGCFIGAGILKTSSPSAVLVVAAGLKGALVLSFLLNRGMVEKKTQLEDGAEKVEGHVTPARLVLWGD